MLPFSLGSYFFVMKFVSVMLLTHCSHRLSVFTSLHSTVNLGTHILYYSETVFCLQSLPVSIRNFLFPISCIQRFQDSAQAFLQKPFPHFRNQKSLLISPLYFFKKSLLCLILFCGVLMSGHIGFPHAEDKDSPYLHLSLPLPKIVSCSEGRLSDLF